jgi:cysteinyl-tRNA synthetase
MSDDFNFPGALAAVAGLFNELNLLCDKPPVKDKALVGRTLQALLGVVKQLSVATGLFEQAPEAWLLGRRERQVRARGIDVARVEALLQARAAARAARDFAAADGARAELKALGVEIMDTPQGTRWKVVPE